jgi:hypothetical protein
MNKDFLDIPNFYQKTIFKPVTLEVQTIINTRDLCLSDSKVEKIIKENLVHQIASKIADELPLKRIPVGDSIHEKWTSSLTYFPEGNQVKMAHDYSDKISILFMLERLLNDPKDIEANIMVCDFIKKVKKGDIDIV